MKGAERESAGRRNKDMYQEERAEAGSEEGESCLFLRQYCMSSGSPFYHSAACNMCSFAVSHSTNILVSFCLQHHGPTMRYPHVLSASLFHSSHEPSPCAHLFTRGSMEPIPQVFRYVCISCQAARHLPPHTVWPKGSPLWDSQPPSVLTAPALPKVWPQEMHFSSRSIRDSSITKTRVQTNAVFLEPSESHS